MSVPEAGPSPWHRPRARIGHVRGAMIADPLLADAPDFGAQERVTLEEVAVGAEIPRGRGSDTRAATTASSTIGLTPGYRNDRAVSASKIDTPQRDLPHIVPSTPRAVVGDRAGTRVDSVFNDTPSLAEQNNFGSCAVCGGTTTELYRNDFPLNRGYPPSPEAQNVERIEVLSGPGGSLVGCFETAAVHDAQDGPLKGFGLGGGVQGVGARAGDAISGVTMPSHIAVDALTYCRYGTLRLGLDVENSFDAAYYERSNNRPRVFPCSPHRFLPTVTARF